MAVFVSGELIPADNTIALNVVNTAYSSVLRFTVVGTETRPVCHKNGNAIRLTAIFADFLNCFFPLRSEKLFVMFPVPFAPLSRTVPFNGFWAAVFIHNGSGVIRTKRTVVMTMLMLRHCNQIINVIVRPVVVYMVDIIAFGNSTIIFFPNINVESDSMLFPVSADLTPKPIPLAILIKSLPIILNVAHSFSFSLNFQKKSPPNINFSYYIIYRCGAICKH